MRAIYSISRQLLIKISVIVLIPFLFCSCSGKSIYNQTTDVAYAKPPYIEGSYIKNIDLEECSRLSGTDIELVLMPYFENEEIEINVVCDNNDKLVNMTIGIASGDEESRHTYIDMHSTVKWSEKGYSTKDYYYNAKQTKDKKSTNINDTDVVFSIFDNNNSDNILTAEFEVNYVKIFVESSYLDKDEFYSLIVKLIDSYQ